MMAMALLATFAQQPAAATDTTRGRPCVIQIDSIGHNYQEATVRPGEKNYFAGGGVLARCQGTGSMLSADSVALFAGVGRFDMVGQRTPVHIRDTAITLDATTAAYFLRQERLEAHKNVVAVNRKTGSVLRGPNLTYYRAVKGGRDIRLVKALGDGVATGADWRLTADTIHLHVDRKKLQQAFAWGPKDSVRARALSTLNTIQADSLALDLPDEVLDEARAFGHA